MSVKKLTLMSILLAAALAIFVAELQLPAPVPIPGIKPGLANIITLVAIVWLGRKEAFTILILRIVLGSFFSGRMVSMLYSLAGGLVCFAVMAAAVKFLGEDKLWVVSVFGAVAHNMGQILAAWLIMGTAAVLTYLPVLIISGIITGAFTGLCAQFTVKRMGKIKDRFLK